jgi:regulator of protease activity HflC (stomatin/prohibitin superfamily)
MQKDLTIGDVLKIGAFATLGVTLAGFAFSATMRYYDVWSQQMQGKARLAEASQSRQIQVEQARGELDASKLRAEAIAIVGKAAKDFPEYREQELMGSYGEALREGKMSQVIYVPTSLNGLPITEANRIKSAE